MKKIIVFLLMCISLIGCELNKKDYSEYSFTDVSWVRDNGHDIETIMFKSNGDFSYFCACGNSVNDSDLCESYTYDNENKEIKLECIETTEDTVDIIRIIDMSDDNFELDFNGEIRRFEKGK